MAQKKEFDVIIIGAGPAGLSFARTLAGTGLRLCLIEKQSLDILKNPPLDGRDIALTHDSIKLLKELAIFDHISPSDISPIHEARVFSGTSPYYLGFDAEKTSKEALGFLVPNNAIRRAAYRSNKDDVNLTIRDKSEVRLVATEDQMGKVHLVSGEVLTAPLVIAADSRFSQTRRQMGIAVSMKEFGRTGIVCRMEHTKPHDKIAQECFFDDWTLAILPLQGNKSSIVITLPTDQADGVLKLPTAAFNSRIEKNLGDRLGKMALTGERYPYPLVGVYAARFTAQRFALMGDAAVGMHPVTAHGYNLGLAGANVLAQEVKKALALGIDIGSPSVLDAYALIHRRASAFLYYGTNLMVGLYTDSRPAALAMRAVGLRVASHLPPFKNFVTRQLTGRAA